MKIFDFVVDVTLLLLNTFATGYHAQSTEGVCRGENMKFSINVGDLQDSSKLNEIREFLREKFEKYGENGLLISTKISTDDEVQNTPTSKPSTETTTVTDASERPTISDETSFTTRYNVFEFSAPSTSGYIETTTSNERDKVTPGRTSRLTIVYKVQRMTFFESQEICANENLVVGVIPNELVYKIIVDKLKKKKGFLGWKEATIWTGLTIEPSTGQLEKPDAFIKWAENQPTTEADHTNVYVQASGGMQNENPAKKLFGVVCQVVQT